MDSHQPNVPWLRVFGAGFMAGLKWGVISLVAEVFILIEMLTSGSKELLSMAIGVPLLLVALALLVALVGMAMFAYYRFRWMRFVALSALLLWLGVPCLILALAPYAFVFSWFFFPTGLGGVGYVVGLAVMAFVMYWVVKWEYAVFVEYNVIGKLFGWMARTANETGQNRLKLKKAIAKLG